MTQMRPASRVSAPFAIEHLELGPLREFPGTWIGTGFNVVARPDFQNNNQFVLEINGTVQRLILDFPPKPNAPIIVAPRFGSYPHETVKDHL